MIPLGASALNSGRPVCVKVKEAEFLMADELPAPNLNKKISKKNSKKNKSPKNQAGLTERTLKKYTPLYWIGEKKQGWIQVNDVNQKKFWVRRSDVSTKLKCVTVRVKKSLARKGPGNDFPVDDTIEKGVGFLDLNSLEDGWVKVSNPEGKTTWINLDHIWRPANLFEIKFQDEKVSGDPE